MGFLQIAGICIALFLWTRALVKFRNNKIPLSEFIIWTSVWGGLIFLAVLPGTVTFFASLLGIGRGVDVAIYFSIILLFYMVFLLFSKLDKQKEDITRLVRAMAIEKKKK